MIERYQIPEGVKIYLEKRIPMAAGMAGGSADAAAVFHGMNELFELGVTNKELCEIALPYGADIPYCICGGTSLAEGIGEQLTPLPNMPDAYLVIAKPDFDVSTKEVFQSLDLSKEKQGIDVDGMVDACWR